MVRRGKMAEVIDCKEAKVKAPVPGCVRMPRRATVTDGMTMAKSAAVTDGIAMAKKVAVTDGMAMARRIKRAGEISSVPIRDGEQSVKKAVPACVQDGKKYAGCVSSANIRDAQRGMECVPVEDIQSVELEGRMQEKHPERADSSLTLAQLFSDSQGILS